MFMKFSGKNAVTAPVSCFFFQAGDGIRDATVTGVQTCALPIWWSGVGVSWEEAEQGKSDADNYKNHDDDYTTKKKAHWDSLGEKSQVYITFDAATRADDKSGLFQYAYNRRASRTTSL